MKHYPLSDDRAFAAAQRMHDRREPDWDCDDRDDDTPDPDIEIFDPD